MKNQIMPAVRANLKKSICPLMDLPVRWIVTLPRAERSKTGAPHLGHAAALLETCVPHSAQVMRAMPEHRDEHGAAIQA
jgi:hypothetical protein